jgi:ERO1-like protein beta
VTISTLWYTRSEATRTLQAPNLQCFIDRVGAHPDRLQQIYFNTVLLLRAVSRLGPYLSAYDYCSTGTHEEDAQTKSLLGNIIDIAHQVGKFDEKRMFAGEDANVSRVSSV